MIVQGLTHHERLQVDSNACVEVIRAAARALLKQCHPDKNPDRQEWAEEQTRMISESLQALTATEAQAALQPAADASGGVFAEDFEWPLVSRADRLFQQAYVNHLHGRYREAIAGYEQCLIGAPRNAAAHYNLGCIYEAQGHRRKAQRAYHAANVVTPGYRDASRRSADLAPDHFTVREVSAGLAAAPA
jgi:tetratricopeptide (TPR) repeat protein